MSLLGTSAWIDTGGLSYRAPCLALCPSYQLNSRLARSSRANISALEGLRDDLMIACLPASLIFNYVFVWRLCHCNEHILCLFNGIVAWFQETGTIEPSRISIVTWSYTWLLEGTWYSCSLYHCVSVLSGEIRHHLVQKYWILGIVSIGIFINKESVKFMLN